MMTVTLQAKALCFFCRTLSYKRILPPSCFDVDGMVLKPQLRTALQALGYQMYEEEFDKVWDRYLFPHACFLVSRTKMFLLF